MKSKTGRLCMTRNRRPSWFDRLTRLDVQGHGDEAPGRRALVRVYQISGVFQRSAPLV